MQQNDGNLLMFNTCIINMCQRAGSFENIFCQKTFFFIDYQGILQYAYCILKYLLEIIYNTRITGISYLSDL